MAKHKGAFTEEEKAEIIRLYTVEKLGKQTIGRMYDRCDGVISHWLKKWGVPNNSRSEVMTKLRETNGPTKGFFGRRHNDESKAKTSESGRKAWESGREVIGARSQTYNTLLGKVLGTYEVAYLQMCYERGGIPTVAHSRIKTPFGTYKPDFEFPDRFVEVKSQFTLDLAKGKYPKLATRDNERQLKKIAYVNEHVKPVEIVVVSKFDGLEYFKRAIQERGIICDM